MQKMFTKYLCIVLFVALLATLLLGWEMEGNNARNRMIENSKLRLTQVGDTLRRNDEELANLTEGLSEDYLTRAHAFAYIIEQNPDVLDSQEELNRIKTLLNVDELHVIDENGILFAGTVPKYFGMDFCTTKQTEEFLQILEDPSKSLVQDIQPNGAEKKIFQYVGVARQDKPGIVQVGLAPVRLMEAQKKNKLPYIFSRLPVDAGSSIFAIDPVSGIILAHTDENMVGETVSELGFYEPYYDKFKDGGILNLDGKKTFYYLQQEDNMILGTGCLAKIVYQSRDEQMKLIFVFFLAVFLVALIAINRLLKRQIVDGVHEIVCDLSRITDGNLDTVVAVESTPEFCQLSHGINQMVKSILDTTVKVSAIIDMLDLPIGAFEFTGDSGKVMATERLRHILLWKEEEAASYCLDKALFQEKLEQVKTLPKAEVADAYRISQEPERWVEIQMRSEGADTFGVVVDVTKEVLEKRKITHERDFDSLTGLCNIDRFKILVNDILEKEPGTAAVIMLDLDFFKGVNDQYGHDWGDEYLRVTARYLSMFELENGIAARRSGDEFCLFLHHRQSRDEIRGMMNRFYKAISEDDLLFPDGTKRHISISAGLAWYEKGGAPEYDAMMKKADTALYQVKKQGKGFWSEFQEII